jgi:hypothetical protein
MKRSMGFAMLSVLGVLTVGCGGDDSSAGASSSGVTVCGQVCDKQAAQMCPNPLMITVDQCKQICGAFGQTTADCQAKLGDLSNCELMQPDICSTGVACKPQNDAMTAACH